MILPTHNIIPDNGITNTYMCFLIRWSIPRMEQRLNSISEGPGSLYLPALPS